MSNWCSQHEIFQYKVIFPLISFLILLNYCFCLFRCLANLLAGLVAYQEEVGTRVVDGVLEDIRLGMEVNLPKFNQRRVAQIKYLGELYNYRIVESADIFKVIDSIPNFT